MLQRIQNSVLQPNIKVDSCTVNLYRKICLFAQSALSIYVEWTCVVQFASDLRFCILWAILGTGSQLLQICCWYSAVKNILGLCATPLPYSTKRHVHYIEIGSYAASVICFFILISIVQRTLDRRICQYR